MRMFAALLILLTAAPALADRTTVAFGSCFRQDVSDGWEFWTPILATEPDTFLFIGDNIYASRGGGDRFDVAYDFLRNNPGFQAVRAATRVLAVWDDHDFGFNDGGREHAGVGEPHFERMFPAADPARDARPGVYDSWITGDPGQRVQVILLDTRTFRSPLTRGGNWGRGMGKYTPSTDPDQEMLGPDQWTWLEGELQKPAEVRLLVSSIQVLAEGHGFERWGNLPAQQEKLFRVIERSGAEGVVLLSGDRHRAAFYKRNDAMSYPLYEVTSSSLNKSFAPNAPETGRYIQEAMVGENNFGLVTVDWEAATLTLEIKTLDGATAQGRTVPLDYLKRR